MHIYSSFQYLQYLYPFLAFLFFLPAFLFRILLFRFVLEIIPFLVVFLCLSKVMFSFLILSTASAI
jgi:hypothetical protein